MNTQKQFAVANYLGASLFVLGLIAIGIGAGLFLGIQSVLEAGCSTQSLGGLSTCQKAIQAMNARVTLSLLAGIIGMVSGGGMMWYLRRRVP